MERSGSGPGSGGREMTPPPPVAYSKRSFRGRNSPPPPTKIGQKSNACKPNLNLRCGLLLRATWKKKTRRVRGSKPWLDAGRCRRAGRTGPQPPPRGLPGGRAGQAPPPSPAGHGRQAERRWQKGNGRVGAKRGGGHGEKQRGRAGMDACAKLWQQLSFCPPSIAGLQPTDVQRSKTDVDNFYPPARPTPPPRWGCGLSARRGADPTGRG